MFGKAVPGSSSDEGEAGAGSAAEKSEKSAEGAEQAGSGPEEELVPGADQVAAAISRADSLSVVDSISVNLAPPRVASYMAHDFSVVQGRVLQFVQRLAARLGYDKVDVGLGLLRELRRLRLVSMFLGLVVSVAMTALSALLCLLIYSLLIVQVDARVYDMGVSRLLGMTRRQLVLQLLAHTLVLSAPASVLGLLAAHLLTAALMRQLAEAAAASGRSAASARRTARPPTPPTTTGLPRRAPGRPTSGTRCA